MNIKITRLTDEQLVPFKNIFSAMGSLATLSVAGSFPVELKVCGINERSGLRNQLVGYVATNPSGSQLVLETVFF